MRTELCDLFGIDVPIFAFSHCRDVVAAVSNAGGMGVLGALAFSPEQLEIELKWIDEHVNGKPYGVDIVMPAKYEGKEEGLGRTEEATGEVDPGVFKKMIPQNVTDWIEGVLEEYEVPPLPQDHAAADGIGGGGSQGLLGWTDGGARNQLDVALKFPVKLLVNALGPPRMETRSRVVRCWVTHDHDPEEPCVQSSVTSSASTCPSSRSAIAATSWPP